MTQIGVYTYQPWTPQDPQKIDYDCAAAATAWFGRSVGFEWTELNVLYEMWNQGLITEQWGLMDATGAGIVKWLSQQPCPASNGALSWSDVQARAGDGPLIMGGAAWDHWTGVRLSVTSTSVALANSALGWMGVGNQMSEAQFDALGPFHGVWLVYE